MTTLNLSLSTTLQTTLETAVSPAHNPDGGVVWGYAVYFVDGKNPVWTELITDAGILHSDGLTKGNFVIDMPEPYKSGKVYFLLQSQTAAHSHVLYNATTPKDSLITTESDLNWVNAETWDLRYDSIEVNFQNGADDEGDLTSVNGYGLPLEFRVEYSNATSASVGYNKTATEMFGRFPAKADTHNIDVIDKYDSGPLSGNDRMAISPTESVGANGPTGPFDGAFRPGDWDAYINTLKVADTGVALTGFFDGAKDANNVWHNGGFYSYKLEWHPDWYPAWDSTWDPSNKGTFFLVAATNSQIQGAIQIWPDQLNKSIYSTLGDAAIYATTDVGADNTPYRIFEASTFATGHYSLNTGDNNQWGDVLAEFLTGFSAGFYGSTGKSFSQDAAHTANLSHNWNWDPEYAFNNNISGAAPTYFDPYAEAFYLVSNSYGNGYTDNLMREFDVGGPLISLSNPTDPNKGKNVSDIYVTIFDDGETPSGFTQPVMNHAIAGPYTAPITSTVNATPHTNANIAFNFFHEAAILNPDTAMFLEIWNGTGWDYLAFTVTEDTPWTTWELNRPIVAGGWSFNQVPNTDQVPGTLVLTGLPVALTDPTDQTSPVVEGPYWYRLNVGGTGTEAGGVVTGVTGGKTFNIYATFDGDGNFKSDGVAIDGLASIALPAGGETSTNTFTALFLTDRGSSIDPSLLQLDFEPLATGPTPPYAGPYLPTTPVAPVVGTSIADNTIAALSGQDSLAASGTIKATEGSLYFGWTGTNPWAQVSETYLPIGASKDVTGVPMAAYTNKVGALNWATITAAPTHGVGLAPTSVQADLDGQWSTGAVALGNGTYTVTMQEFQNGTGGPSTTAINNASLPITLEVNVSELNLGLDTGGHGVDLVSPKPHGPSGNWVQLETVGSHAPIGTVLVLYATNADGELVSRDGLSSGAGVTLDEAALTTIGVVEADGGADVMQGLQSVYVRDDLQLHFAALHGDGTVEMNLAVTAAQQTITYMVPTGVSQVWQAIQDQQGRTGDQSGILERPDAWLAKHGFTQMQTFLERAEVPTQTSWLGQRFGTEQTDAGQLKVSVGGFVLEIETDNTLSKGAMLGDAQRQTGDAFVYLEHGAVLDVSLYGNSTLSNRLGFVRMDIDPSTGDRSVNGVAYGNTADFRTAVSDHLDDGFTFTKGGSFQSSAKWTVAGADGYYAPVLISGHGDVFVIGEANSDGLAHVRTFGQNTFGFEELTGGGGGADFDFNDMVVGLSPSDEWLMA